MLIKLVSWNIQWGRGTDGCVNLGRVAKAIEPLHADVICLQEVAVNHPGLPGGAGGDQPARLGDLFPGYETIYGVGSDLADGAGGRRQFGVLVLSRLPVLQVFRHLLPWPADPEVPSMQRVALEAVVSVPWGSLRVVTTHLEFYSALQRAAQVEALRAVHAEGWRHALKARSAAETDPPFAVVERGAGLVLCGDFNFQPGAAEYRRLQAPQGDGAPSLMDAWMLAHPGKIHAPTAGVHGADFLAAPICCDFCFVSENLARRVRGMSVDAQSQASDHQFLLMELEG